MRVKELIEKLKEYPQDATMCITFIRKDKKVNQSSSIVALSRISHREIGDVIEIIACEDEKTRKEVVKEIKQYNERVIQ